MKASFPAIFVAISLAVVPTSVAQSTTSFAPVKTLPYEFTLAALNTTLPNANDTGVPLVLGDEYFLPGSALYITSTYASWPYKENNNSLGLVSGAMRGYDPEGAWTVNASLVVSGYAMTWLGSYMGSPETDQFTAIHAARGHKYASLAAHGQDALWSLCPTGNKDGKNEVFYNISSATSHSSVVVKDCYKVTLQIIPVRH
ncbi:uncharacterized protein SCHCODRAFT_01193880 [Schizophyllum commune H4-8]|uniref:Uncharacterized protein n=1 Tax=Schizophyllum commune (strain H4-8 / FGSC 9210) TaxID=578458 RepID=D8QJT8_SCHCM|nr:uncharacterized protein SCHCODRAFT_01193880 [Schizophyllum commune H4-8]KAI5885546.1 hypothetical protein SCHCODRAFT_01193880 [Schizophyllum commune H4-8]